MSLTHKKLREIKARLEKEQKKRGKPCGCVLNGTLLMACQEHFNARN